MALAVQLPMASRQPGKLTGMKSRPSRVSFTLLAPRATPESGTLRGCPPPIFSVATLAKAETLGTSYCTTASLERLTFVRTPMPPVAYKPNPSYEVKSVSLPELGEGLNPSAASRPPLS